MLSLKNDKNFRFNSWDSIIAKSKNFTIRKLSYANWYEIVVFGITKNQSKTKKPPENTKEDRIYIQYLKGRGGEIPPLSKPTRPLGSGTRMIG